ncbi:MAG TPA: hypothetical protein VLH60_06195 [Sedimentisphaerales bacterium]|nr:hypothetical protein [Sedimentisphaerales bacterium]
MRLQIIIAVAAFTIVCPSLLAAATGAEAQIPATTPTPAQTVFPYQAEVVGNNVFIRAGAGLTSYRCGQISAPARVVVIGDDPSGWAKIEPPAGSFSWIFRHNVTIDPATPDTATVTVQPTRVWAGSVFHDPLNSNELQLKLNAGDTVRLLGEVVGDYYKIAPPQGAYLWISTEFIRRLDAATTVAGTTPTPGTQPTPPAENLVEREKLAEYRKLAAELDLERAKPIPQQDYTSLRAAFEALAKDPAAGRAGRFAAIQLERIVSFELAAQSYADIRQKEQALTELRARIDAEAQAKMDAVPDLGRYAVIGIFRPSMVHADRTGAARRFLVMGDGDNILCYAQPTGPAQDRDFSEFHNKKVGLVGAIGPDPASSLPLVQFTDIVLIQ